MGFTSPPVHARSLSLSAFAAPVQVSPDSVTAIKTERPRATTASCTGEAAPRPSGEDEAISEPSSEGERRDDVQNGDACRCMVRIPIWWLSDVRESARGKDEEGQSGLANGYGNVGAVWRSRNPAHASMSLGSPVLRASWHVRVMRSVDRSHRPISISCWGLSLHSRSFRRRRRDRMESKL